MTSLSIYSDHFFHAQNMFTNPRDGQRVKGEDWKGMNVHHAWTTFRLYDTLRIFTFHSILINTLFVKTIRGRTSSCNLWRYLAHATCKWEPDYYLALGSRQVYPRSVSLQQTNVNQKIRTGQHNRSETTRRNNATARTGTLRRNSTGFSKVNNFPNTKPGLVRTGRIRSLQPQAGLITWINCSTHDLRSCPNILHERTSPTENRFGRFNTSWHKLSKNFNQIVHLRLHLAWPVACQTIFWPRSDAFLVFWKGTTSLAILTNWWFMVSVMNG